ncbi:MAG: hypothetical protein GC129_03340 [Proteobacteria bacterium]|nr:hypothetical protein [Pseudomonadota bacterium]
MQAQAAFDTTFDQRLAKLDLTRVMQKAADSYGLSEQTLTVAEDLYRKFLTLKGRYPQLQLVPPVLVDKVWDTHVMFTRQYAADCEMLFGEFLHHQPHLETDDFDAEGLFSTTRELYKSDFAVDFTRTGLRAEHFRAAFCS